MKKKNDSLKSLIVLISICLVIAVAMAVINSVTAPKIDEASKKAEQEALRTVLADATEFEKIEGDYPETVKAVYFDMGGSGCAVMVSAKGYDSSNPMSIAVGVGNDGKIVKVHVVSCSGETTGIGTKVSEEGFLSLFTGADSSMSGVDAISGATISSSAFIDAVADACEAANRVMQEDGRS